MQWDLGLEGLALLGAISLAFGVRLVAGRAHGPHVHGGRHLIGRHRRQYS